MKALKKYNLELLTLIMAIVIATSIVFFRFIYDSKKHDSIYDIIYFA